MWRKEEGGGTVSRQGLRFSGRIVGLMIIEHNPNPGWEAPLVTTTLVIGIPLQISATKPLRAVGNHSVPGTQGA